MTWFYYLLFSYNTYTHFICITFYIHMYRHTLDGCRWKVWLQRFLHEHITSRIFSLFLVVVVAGFVKKYDRKSERTKEVGERRGMRENKWKLEIYLFTLRCRFVNSFHLPYKGHCTLETECLCVSKVTKAWAFVWLFQ